MLKPEMFTKGENSGQFYYAFNNEVTSELIQIIRNKKEEHWFGMYIGKNRFFTIPIQFENDPQVMLEKVVEWYNNGKQEPISHEVEEVIPKKIGKTLLEIENVFGKFPLKSAQRIQAYLDEPSFDRWEDIHSIIVNGWTTVRQAVVDQDPTFPRTGRGEDITGKIVKEWERIPEPMLVLRAIKATVKKED
ncbi:hypothetical protein MZM54_02920 [[Brevibacterium] frigoritolerans]|nr:hypothetical protein [Peribacillus frigoritolerans]